MPSKAPVVLVVGPIPPPVHGAARVTAQVVHALEGAGASVVAVDTSGSSTAAGWGYHVARLRMHMRAIRVVWQHRRRASSLYVAGAGGLGLWYQLLVVGAARLTRLQIVFHHHSYAYVREPNPAMRALVRVGGRQLVHVALCSRMAEGIRTTYPSADRVHVCSNAGMLPPSPAARPERRRSERRRSERRGPERRGPERITIGHLGNLSVEKGLSLVFDTLRELRRGGVDAQLLLAGPLATDAAITVFARAHADLGDAIEHVGPIDPADVESFHERIDAFIFPSRYTHEAEPLVVLEAARCGVPTVAFRVGCLAALVTEEDQLVAPDADFAPAAARVVSRLVDDAERVRRQQATLHDFAARRQEAGAAQRRLVDTLVLGRAARADRDG